MTELRNRELGFEPRAVRLQGLSHVSLLCAASISGPRALRVLVSLTPGRRPAPGKLLMDSQNSGSEWTQGVIWAPSEMGSGALEGKVEDWAALSHTAATSHMQLVGTQNVAL